jgi:biotin transport system substrate-specific component
MSTLASPVVLADALPFQRVRARSAVLVVGFALLTALGAQLRLHLGWTPVPITGQTFAAVLAGGVLGARLGALSQLTYMAFGLVLPFYAGGTHGWEVLTGATGGYIVGMVLSAYLVGLLAERKEDRSFLTAVPAMLFGSAIVYVVGVPWLAMVADFSAQDAIAKGLAPFVIGDAAKALLAGALLPTAWRVARPEH